MRFSSSAELAIHLPMKAWSRGRRDSPKTRAFFSPTRPWEPSLVNRRGTQMDVLELEKRIDALVADPTAVRGKKGRAVDEVIEALDEGQLRVAEFDGESWITHAW